MRRAASAWLQKHPVHWMAEGNAGVLAAAPSSSLAHSVLACEASGLFSAQRSLVFILVVFASASTLCLCSHVLAVVFDNVLIQLWFK